MPRSSLAASLLQSGYQLVNQEADRPVLPENYKPPIPQIHPSDDTQPQAGPPTHLPGPRPPIPLGQGTFLYPGGCSKITNLRVYYPDTLHTSICGMKIGYGDDEYWTGVMGKKTRFVQYWDRQPDEEISRIISMLALLVWIFVAVIWFETTG